MLGRARGAKTIKPILNEEFLSKCGLNKPEDIVNEKNDNGGKAIGKSTLPWSRIKKTLSNLMKLIVYL